MNAAILDANILLRFLLQDDPRQSPAVTAFLGKADEQDMRLFLPDAVVVEVTFVMEKTFRRTRVQIADALLDFVQYPFVELGNFEVFTDALVRYRTYPVDFVDALVASWAASRNVPALSFDRDLDRFKDVRRVEPRA